MTEIPFEKITLPQLCSRYLVPRSTFYRYFEDKYDLLYYCLQSFLDDSHLEQDVIYLADPQTSKAFLTQGIQALARHKDAFARLYLINKDGILMDIIRDFLVQVLDEQLKISRQHGMELTLAQPIFTFLLADFYISIAKCYLESQETYTVEEFVEHVVLFANKNFFQAGHD